MENTSKSSVDINCDAVIELATHVHALDVSNNAAWLERLRRLSIDLVTQSVNPGLLVDSEGRHVPGKHLLLELDAIIRVINQANLIERADGERLSRLYCAIADKIKND